MRWSIVRLICLRELRDQLRDRRTIFMIAVLPLILYPVLGTAVVQFAVGAGDKPSEIGIAGAANLPPLTPAGIASQTGAVMTWVQPSPGGPGLDGIVAAAVLVRAWNGGLEAPPLIIADEIPRSYFESAGASRALRLQMLSSDDREPLDSKQIDLLVIVPANFRQELDAGGQPSLTLLGRPNDEASHLAAQRFYSVLAHWKQAVRGWRLGRLGVSADYADPFNVIDPERDRPVAELAAESMVSLLVKIFPFLLVMWSLAGALYPAVDVCAGEKERGTMETLLISPASREEIVWGKFFTIWIFSAATVFLNLIGMGITAWISGGLLTGNTLGFGAAVWCALLALPLSAFFSALCLSVGAYARSSKEGQYYLMPLFLVTMPLVFMTLAPGVELNPFYSLVPVTGAALLMQKLMTAPINEVPWLYFIPVLAPLVLYSWLALRWAIEQFRREEVLFREAERLEIRLWLRRLFREKEALPSTGQAFFCFGLILAVRWLFFSGSWTGPLLVRTGIAYFAFAAAPPLFMSLLLTTRPLLGLRLRRPSLTALATACLLAGLLLLPFAELTSYILSQFPGLKPLLSERSPLLEELMTAAGGVPTSWWQYVLVFALIPAVFEEIAFRGFILSGLQRRLSPWTAVLVSSALFALYHLNVFNAAPALLLGVVLGTLTLWSGSIFPAMAFHFVTNVLLITPPLLPSLTGYREPNLPAADFFFHPAIVALCALGAAAVLAWIVLQVKNRNGGGRLEGAP